LTHQEAVLARSGKKAPAAQSSKRDASAARKAVKAKGKKNAPPGRQGKLGWR